MSFSVESDEIMPVGMDLSQLLDPPEVADVGPSDAGASSVTVETQSPALTE